MAGLDTLDYLVIVFFVGVVMSGVITYKLMRKSYTENYSNLKSQHDRELSERLSEKDRVIQNYKNKDVIRNSAHEERMSDLDKTISYYKSRSKVVLDKAVDFAFDFEKIFKDQHKNAQAEIQNVLDDSYRFKRKTLLSALSLKNFEKKLEDIKKERDKYQSLIAKYDFFELIDNSDWNSVENEFRNKVLSLQEAQDEREAQNEIKRQMREERQRADELEKQQQEAEAKELELEVRRKAVEEALLAADEDHRQELEDTRRRLEQEIEDVHKQYERAKSMAQMTKQGHVYVISNIGSFGENVFKIGMTRRLEPLMRVSELSGASVPFEFDVHAMISCDDAPALEAKLHSVLSDERINKVNLRKEFFRTNIEKIIKCVEDNHGKVEYVANPAALQYYRTLEISDGTYSEGEHSLAS